VGKPDNEVAQTSAIDTIHPDDRALVGSRIENVLKNDVAETVEGRVLLRGGPAFQWLLMTGRRMMFNDRPFLISIGIDITERKQAEVALAETKALLQAALDHSQAGIAIADAPSGRLLYVNKAGLLIGGETEGKLVAGVEVNQYVASWKLLNLDRTPLAKEEVPLARAVLFGEQCTREFIIRRSEHDDRIVLANAAPIRNPAGAVTAGIVVLLDITEHKRAEDLLRQNTEELRARNQELTRFNRLMTGRELRTIELKQQVNDLAAQLGQSRPYPLAFLDAAAAEVVRTTPKPNDQGAEVRGQKSEVSDQKSEVSKTQKEKSP
jgi:PAS domain S-box-containing protein